MTRPSTHRLPALLLLHLLLVAHCTSAAGTRPSLNKRSILHHSSSAARPQRQLRQDSSPITRDTSQPATSNASSDSNVTVTSSAVTQPQESTTRATATSSSSSSLSINIVSAQSASTSAGGGTSPYGNSGMYADNGHMTTGAMFGIVVAALVAGLCAVLGVVGMLNLYRTNKKRRLRDDAHTAAAALAAAAATTCSATAATATAPKEEQHGGIPVYGGPRQPRSAPAAAVSTENARVKQLEVN